MVSSSLAALRSDELEGATGDRQAGSPFALRFVGRHLERAPVAPGAAAGGERTH